MKFTHATFDCYGTLIDWRKGIERHLGELLRSNGLAPDVSIHPLYVKLEAEEEGQYKSYREILRDTAMKVADQLKVSITQEQAKEFAASVPSWPTFSDTVETLAELGKRGYKRVILSNIDRHLLKETITQSSLDVDGFITAEDVGSYKPALGHWKRFFEVYKPRREATIHVAQSIYHDIIPSSKLSISNAWINRYSEAKPPAISPSYAFEDLKGLLSVLT